MNDRGSTPGSHDDQVSREPAGAEDAREAALTQQLLSLQERHREGGIEAELVLGGENGNGTLSDG